MLLITHSITTFCFGNHRCFFIFFFFWQILYRISPAPHLFVTNLSYALPLCWRIESAINSEYVEFNWRMVQKKKKKERPNNRRKEQDESEEPTARKIMTRIYFFIFGIQFWMRCCIVLVVWLFFNAYRDKLLSLTR